MDDATLRHRGRRLWGIDVIAGIYGVATLLMVWLYFNGTPTGRAASIVLGPICLGLCLGIAFRVNVVRVALMILLVIAVIGDGLLALFYIGAVIGLFQGPANKDPIDQLVRLPFRVGGTLTMLLYLWLSDVRDAFRARSRGGEIREVGVTENETD